VTSDTAKKDVGVIASTLTSTSLSALPLPCASERVPSVESLNGHRQPYRRVTAALRSPVPAKAPLPVSPFRLPLITNSCRLTETLNTFHLSDRHTTLLWTLINSLHIRFLSTTTPVPILLTHTSTLLRRLFSPLRIDADCQHDRLRFTNPSICCPVSFHQIDTRPP
jgi:hypothetical protein